MEHLVSLLALLACPVGQCAAPSRESTKPQQASGPAGVRLTREE